MGYGTFKEQRFRLTLKTKTSDLWPFDFQGGNWILDICSVTFPERPRRSGARGGVTEGKNNLCSGRRKTPGQFSTLEEALSSLALTRRGRGGVAADVWVSFTRGVSSFLRAGRQEVEATFI